MKIVFMGTPEFSVNVLQALIDSSYEVIGVVTQPDRKAGRKQILTPPPIKELAVKYNIPVFQPEKIRNDYQKVLDWKPDMIITCAYGQIIPAILLDTPPKGAVNVHASLLPKYRGGAPIEKAIMDGCQKTGITIMHMSPKMDAGDIISQREIPIEYKDTSGTLHEKLSKLGAQLLMDTLPSIVDGTAPRIKQNENEVTFAYTIKPEEEKIDWTKDGEDIYNHIRALNPYPGAYTVIDGKRVKIVTSEEVVRIHNTIPGEIIRVYTDAVLVTTGGETCIKITEIQMEGKKIQTMKDVLNGNHPFIIGNFFE